MASIFNVDHRIIAGGALAVTASIAVYSTYKYYSIKKVKEKENTYETKKTLDEYLAFHYASPEDMLPYDFGPQKSLDFPVRCAELCMRHFVNKPGVPSRALDIGCAVGRSSFEMTKAFDEVIGIDYSRAFINACNELKQKGKLSYSLFMVGELHKDCTATIDSQLDRSKTSFRQGDACSLSPNLGQFGCVLAANLICRLHSPKDFLNRLASLVVTDGILVITSPYSISTEYTPKDKWFGGYKEESGREVSGFEGLKKILSPAFDLVTDENMPFFIRETARKNQWTVAHATVWRRKT